MRKDDEEQSREKDADDLRARFPDPDSDERLRAPSASELPPVPEVTFTRPNTQTARGGQSVPTGTDAGGSGQQAGEFRNLGVASTIGFSLVGSIIAGTLLGWLADRYLLHSAGTPWGLIVGFFAGVLSGFINLIRATNRLNQ